MTGKGLRWAGLAVVAATVVLAVVLAGRFGSDPGLVDSPLLGQPAPDFDLSTLDGSGTAALSDLRGQIVVLNFFASWCLECREEHEDLVAASNSFADDGVQFVQIAYQEATEESLTYLDEAGTSPATLYLADPGSRTAIAYGVFGIPETFFIDAGGTVVGKAIGATDALVLGSTIDAVLEGEKPGQQVLGETFDGPAS